MPGLRRFPETGGVEEGGEPPPAAAAHHRQPLAHEGPVEAVQRHDVGDGGQRHEVEPRHQVGNGEPVAAQAPVERHQRQEDHAGGAEMAEAREVVEAVRVDEGVHRREHLGRAVMVEHHHVHAEAPGLGQGLVPGGAAIDGDEEGRALLGEHPHRRDVGAVAFRDAVGDVEPVGHAEVAQRARQQGGTRRPVDVVIAEDRDLLALLDRDGEPVGRGLHVDQHGGVGQEVAQARLEEARHGMEIDPAAGQHPGQHLRQAVALRDGDREALRRRRGAALVPGPPERGAVNVEEGAGQVEERGHGESSGIRGSALPQPGDSGGVRS